MTRARADVGRAGERLAAEALAERGFAIVARNYRCAEGEIDIVARRGTVWHFVEVRTRRGESFGTPEESITGRKRRHLVAAAQRYLLDHALGEVDWCVDLVAIRLGAGGHLLRLNLIENAVQG